MDTTVYKIWLDIFANCLLILKKKSLQIFS
jgi:hypothetical protein